MFAAEKIRQDSRSKTPGKQSWPNISVNKRVIWRNIRLEQIQIDQPFLCWVKCCAIHSLYFDENHVFKDEDVEEVEFAIPKVCPIFYVFAGALKGVNALKRSRNNAEEGYSLPKIEMLAFFVFSWHSCFIVKDNTRKAIFNIWSTSET